MPFHSNSKFDNKTIWNFVSMKIYELFDYPISQKIVKSKGKNLWSTTFNLSFC